MHQNRKDDLNGSVKPNLGRVRKNLKTKNMRVDPVVIGKIAIAVIQILIDMKDKDYPRGKRRKYNR